MRLAIVVHVGLQIARDRGTLSVYNYRKCSYNSCKLKTYSLLARQSLTYHSCKLTIRSSLMCNAGIQQS